MAQALIVLPSQTPDIEIKSFELLETEENWKSLELRSPQAEIFKSQNLVGIESPKAVIWNREGSPTSVSSESGIINSSNGNVQMSGATQIEAPSGMLFETVSITFLNKEKKIFTDNPVKGHSKTVKNQKPSLEIKGSGLEVDVKSQSYSILNNVVASQTHATDFFNITSNTATIYPINNRAQFLGAASVKSKKMLLKGDNATLIMGNGAKEASIEGIEMSSANGEANVFAKIDDFVIISKGFKASFNPTGELKDSKATGSVDAVSPSGVKMNAQVLKLVPSPTGFVVNLEQGVKITIDDRIATCEEAVYYPSSGNIVLKKFASVVRKDQKLHGDLIRLSTNNSEIIIDKASGTLSRDALKKTKSQ